MNLQTARCLVRPFQEKDLPAFIAYRNNDAWMRYQGYKNQTQETYARDLLKEQHLSQGAQFAIILYETGNCIGDIYLMQENDIFWIGYTIAPEGARKGYAYEVLRAVLPRLRTQGATAVQAGVLPENMASIHLLKKLQFQYIGRDTPSGEELYRLPL